MKELIQIIAMAVGGSLFALGGWTWKGWRRYVLPAALYGLLFWYGADPTRLAVSMLVLCGVLHLGYGEKHSYPSKFMVGCTYSIPSSIFGFTLWQILIPIIFITLFACSNWSKTAKDMFWKAVEFITGMMIVISLLAVV